MEVVAKLLTNLDRYDEKTFDKHFTLRRGAQTQESVFIAPYQDDELEKVAYPSVALRKPLSAHAAGGKRCGGCGDGAA